MVGKDGQVERFEWTELENIAPALYDELVKLPAAVEMEDADSRNLKVFFESSFGDMTRHKIADALCNSTLVVFIGSQSTSTFNSISNLPNRFI